MFSRIIFSLLALFFATFIVVSNPLSSLAESHEGTEESEGGDMEDTEEGADEEMPGEESEEGEAAPDPEENKEEM